MPLEGRKQRNLRERCVLIALKEQNDLGDWIQYSNWKYIQFITQGFNYLYN